MNAIAASLFARFASRQDDSPAMKAVAAMRNQFGGHAMQTAAPPTTEDMAATPPTTVDTAGEEHAPEQAEAARRSESGSAAGES